MTQAARHHPQGPKHDITHPRRAGSDAGDQGPGQRSVGEREPQPPLTRRERAENVRKRDVFTKYGPQARAVLDALLTKYQDEGVLNLDDAAVLRITPFSALGTPMQLIKAFGGKDGFEQAVHDLQTVSASNLRNVRFPLPPLAEQHRIVAKVDELMALCDRLAASLAAAQTGQSRLLNALLHEALLPADSQAEAA